MAKKTQIFRNPQKISLIYMRFLAVILEPETLESPSNPLNTRIIV